MIASCSQAGTMSRDPSSWRAGPGRLEVLLALSLILLLVLQPNTCHASPSHRSRHHEHELHAQEAAASSSSSSSSRTSEELPRPAAFANNDPLIVHTKKGMVRGKTLTATTGKEVDAWLGIPYAQKPLGTSRRERRKAERRVKESSNRERLFFLVRNRTTRRLSILDSSVFSLVNANLAFPHVSHVATRG